MVFNHLNDHKITKITKKVEKNATAQNERRKTEEKDQKNKEA